MAKKLSVKTMDLMIEKAWRRIGAGVAIDIMDISKVFDIGREALRAGEELDAAMLRAVVLFGEKGR